MIVRNGVGRPAVVVRLHLDGKEAVCLIGAESVRGGAVECALGVGEEGRVRRHGGDVRREEVDQERLSLVASGGVGVALEGRAVELVLDDRAVRASSSAGDARDLGSGHDAVLGSAREPGLLGCARRDDDDRREAAHR